MYNYVRMGTFATTAGAVADLNGDNHLDLAVLDWKNNKLFIYLGRGDGTFLSFTNFTFSDTPQYVLAEDFDGDGIIDLAVTVFGGGNNGTLQLFRGKGDGTFQPRLMTTLGKGAQHIVSGDFNEDGFLDIAIADPSVPGIGVLLGKGDATFRTLVNYPAGPTPWSITAADLNRDGILDLVVGDNNENGYLRVLLGRGDGTFQSATKIAMAAGFTAGYLTVGDINRDGRPDVVVVAFRDVLPNRVYVMLNREGVATNTVPPAFQLDLQGPPGHSNIVEVTSDFLAWSPIYTNANPTGTLRFQDSPPAGTSRRFYRTRQGQ